MPVSQPLEKYLEGKYFEDVVLVIIDVAKTLLELHQRNISHRDIKPENLLFKDSKAYIGDFGLVDYPDKVPLTSSGDAIGAKWTMAPEMRRLGSKADGKPADVYSLAKTLWILITRNRKGFDGQYHANSVNGLRNVVYTVKEKVNNSSINNLSLEFQIKWYLNKKRNLLIKVMRDQNNYQRVPRSSIPKGDLATRRDCGFDGCPDDSRACEFARGSERISAVSAKIQQRV